MVYFVQWWSYGGLDDERECDTLAEAVKVAAGWVEEVISDAQDPSTSLNGDCELVIGKREQIATIRF